MTADRQVPLTELFGHEGDRDGHGQGVAVAGGPGRRSTSRVRWTAGACVAALGLVGLVTLLTVPWSHDRREPHPRTVEPAPGLPLAPVVQDEPASEVVPVVGDAVFDRARVPAGPRELVVGKAIDPYPRSEAQALVAVLPLARVRADCVQTALLQLDVARVDGVGQVGVYASTTAPPGQGPLTESEQSRAVRLLDNRPRGSAVVQRPGPVQVDVSDLYQLWAGGKAFPSQGRTVPTGTPLVLVVRPTDATPGQWQVALQGPPSVQYLLHPGCS